MSRDTTLRMSLSQQIALTTTQEDGQLTVTDRRTMTALSRRGWVSEQRKGRRTLWRITAAGRAALANNPEIVPPRVRPAWREGWTHVQHAQGRYTVEGHELLRPHRGMLWRVVCPHAPAAEVATCESVAEAVEKLADHLYRGH